MRFNMISQRSWFSFVLAGLAALGLWSCSALFLSFARSCPLLLASILSFHALSCLLSFLFFFFFSFFSLLFFFFFFNDTATTEIYTLSLHDALPTCLSPSRP